MISNDKYQIIKSAIKVHSRLKGRTYFLLYKVNAKQPSGSTEFTILEENFWHLVGCRMDETLHLTSAQKYQLYYDCLEGKDISKYLVYTRQPQDVIKKSNVVIQVFDFITNAKATRICITDGTPESFMFQVGAGSANGLIGYGDSPKGMIPKTAQQKSIYKIQLNANNKIFLILSKPYGFAKYNQVEYKISPKIFPAILSELPKEIQYENHLFPVFTQ